MVATECLCGRHNYATTTIQIRCPYGNSNHVVITFCARSRTLASCNNLKWPYAMNILAPTKHSNSGNSLLKKKSSWETPSNESSYCVYCNCLVSAIDTYNLFLRLYNSKFRLFELHVHPWSLAVTVVIFSDGNGYEDYCETDYYK